MRLMNRLRPGSIEWIDPREDGMLRTSNVIKFLDSCFANGLQSEDLFQHYDLIDPTTDSLSRVANTIISLVKWAENPPPTHSLLLQSGENFRSSGAPPFLPSRSRVIAGADDSPFMRIFGLSGDDAMTHWTGYQSSSPPTMNSSVSPSPKSQSISPPTRNQSITPSTKEISISPSPKNQPISPSPKNQPISPSPKNQPISPSPKSQHASPSPKNQTISSSPKSQHISPLMKNMSISPSTKSILISPSTGSQAIIPSRLKQSITSSNVIVNRASQNVLGFSTGDEDSASDKFGTEPWPHSERRVLRFASDRHASPSDPDTTEDSASRQRLVVEGDSKAGIQVVSTPSWWLLFLELADSCLL